MDYTAASHGLILGQNAPGYTRSPGLHMSHIYNDLYAKLDPKKYSRAGPMPLDKLEAGMIWEEMIEAGFKARPSFDPAVAAWRPGEFRTEEHGIAYSPDLLMTNGVTRLGEIKATWYSARYVPVSQAQAVKVGRPDLANDRVDFDGRFSKWMTQIKAYLYHLRLLDARLIVFFVNGNYKPPSPVVLAWDLVFTQHELDEEWAMLLNHARSEGLV